MKTIAFTFFGLFFLSRSYSIDSDSTKIKGSIDKQIYTSVHEGKGCEKIELIRNIIDEAITIGAPTYNQGNVIGCYRIYEGAAYKILHKYGSKCKDVNTILETALEKSYGNYTSSEKAWIMRVAFDQILGVPTTTTTK